MFIQTKTELIPLWSQQLRPWGLESVRVGTTTQEQHVYRCDHCRRTYAVIVKPAEPFYCDCNRLISIEPEPIDAWQAHLDHCAETGRPVHG